LISAEEKKMAKSVVKLQGFGDYDNKQPMAPAFRLTATDGSPVASGNYKQRNPLVLYFLPDADPEILTRLEMEVPAYNEYKAKLIALVRQPAETLASATAGMRLSYPVLSDADGAIFEKYLKLSDKPLPANPVVGVYVLDRYGAATRYAVSDAPETLPPVDEIAATLDFLTNLCNP
jgi:peroxiredoxin